MEYKSEPDFLYLGGSGVTSRLGRDPGSFNMLYIVLNFSEFSRRIVLSVTAVGGGRGT